MGKKHDERASELDDRDDHSAVETMNGVRAKGLDIVCGTSTDGEIVCNFYDKQNGEKHTVKLRDIVDGLTPREREELLEDLRMTMREE